MTTSNERSRAGGQIDWRAIAILALFGTISALLYLPAQSYSSILLQLCFAASATGVIAIIIWQACDPFAEAAQWIGRRFRIAPSVRGATLDAVASSMPELFSAVFFVMVAVAGTTSGQERLAESTVGFSSSIAICAGSSIYNLILIPAVCAITIAATRRELPVVEFSKEVVHRDGTWVIGAQLALLVMLFLPSLHWWMGLLGLLAYGVYIGHLAIDARRYRRDTIEDEEADLEGRLRFCFGIFSVRSGLISVVSTIMISTLVAAGACYALVELTNYSAESMHVPPFFVAVILAAAASSIPDTFVSVGSARRGDDSGAISNVFGSNIFDICVGMSVPLIVCCYFNNWQPLVLITENEATIRGVAGLRVLLFVLSAVAMFMLWRKRRIDVWTGYFFCVLYLIFVGYAVLGSIGII